MSALTLGVAAALSLLPGATTASAESTRAVANVPISTYAKIVDGDYDFAYATTTDAGQALKDQGFTYEGVAAYIYPTDTRNPDAVPLYQVYNAGRTDHALVTGELDALKQRGYENQGPIGRVLLARKPGSVPMYALYKRTGHFYTTKESVRRQYVTARGFAEVQKDNPMYAYTTRHIDSSGN
ncbi:hypothetical protein ACF073_36855 [Streptomyces sp. NPDC015171]|uniref:hypothetical protein n=1 Tax=Streptomyces sp. NPDC015171 TaxID=3364945 RepID=UPI003702D6B8